MSFVYITEPETKISKRNNRITISRNNEVILEIPEETMEGLVVFGPVQMSAQLICALLQEGKPVTWLSGTGKFYGRLESTSHCNVQKQNAQILLRQEPGFYLELARRIILAKVDSQLVLLRRYSRNIPEGTLTTEIKNICAFRKNMFFASNIEQIMGNEGIVAKYYFSALSKVVSEEFAFKGRTRRPPRDAFNSMLSFGYTLLMYEVYTAIVNQGLHPYFGFLHSLRNGHPALASDLIEEWRAIIIDSMVLSIITHHKLSKNEFTTDVNGGVFLKQEGSKKFIREFEKKMRTTNQYMGEKMSFRESISAQVALFSKAVISGRSDVYVPFKIR